MKHGAHCIESFYQCCSHHFLSQSDVYFELCGHVYTSVHGNSRSRYIEECVCRGIDTFLVYIVVCISSLEGTQTPEPLLYMASVSSLRLQCR